MKTGRSVHKFGGALLKDAEGIRQVLACMAQLAPQHPVLVVSALGKTTNALELVWKEWVQASGRALLQLEAAWEWHLDLLRDLGVKGSPESMLRTYQEARKLIREAPPESYRAYDALVSFGEKWSSALISYLLENPKVYGGSQKIDHLHLNAGELIRTDDYYREAHVLWQESRSRVREIIPEKKTVITQGFIARSSDGSPTTLGREGSDYSAAILAWCLDASEVHIWKDVPGVLNADPRYFKDAKLLPGISYREAIEMAYYGASIIHPRTIQPLQDKNIPLYARPLENPDSRGTCIGPEPGPEPIRTPAGFILKPDQILLSFRSRDLGFITEEHLVHIFMALSQCRFRVNLMQNSAVSFSVSADNKGDLPKLLSMLQDRCHVQYNEGLELLTVRHYREQDLESASKRGKILLEQRNRSAVQWIIQS